NTTPPSGAPSLSQPQLCGGETKRLQKGANQRNDAATANAAAKSRVGRRSTRAETAARPASAPAWTGKLQVFVTATAPSASEIAKMTRMPGAPESHAYVKARTRSDSGNAMTCAWRSANRKLHSGNSL